MKILSALLIVVFLGINTEKVSKLQLLNSERVNEMSFKDRIDSINSKVDLTDIFELHHVKEFNDIYFHPLKFKDSVIEFLRKPTSFENQLIVICSMTRLPLDQYISLLYSYQRLYDKKLINARLFQRCIFNEFDTSNILIKNYKNTKIQYLLEHILKSKTVSKEFRTEIVKTLNGELFNDLKRTGHRVGRDF